MDHITKFVEEKIAPPLIKFSQYRYIQVIQRTGLGIMSLLIIGSIFTLLSAFPVPAYQNFIGGFKTTLASAAGVGTAFIALYTVITTSYALVEWYNKNKGEKTDIIQPMILAVASYLLINPVQTVNTLVKGSKTPVPFAGLPVTYMGAIGVFSAIMVGILSVEMYRFFIRRHWTIKLPENVPPMVSSSFSALIPASCVIIIWWLFRFVLNLDLPKLISDIFQPLVVVGDTPWAVLVATFLNRILWSVGIHGGNIVSGVAGTFWTQMFTANQTAFQAGKALPYTFTSVLMDNYIWTGVFPLAVVLLTCKSQRLKKMGWLALPAAIFNIGEPLIFGLPIMLNPLMMIPFILSSFIVAIVAVIMVPLHWLPIPVLTIPWITPAPIKAFLSTNGSWAAVAFVVVGWLFSMAVFYPFVKAMDNAELKGDLLDDDTDKVATTK
ncbi:PTS sugar transporter subunit IIC [Schleiferilactobacillus harbinensis]|uniref:PTS sugar transporter subunit IIC n=1 Tax=Schleiferilactobacillus harbinensis TaxID=304207 RepID=UPI00116BD967|nr:PTS transporter subunit EIIC [Schleiferilactobacillus harbinensis]GEK06932.1 putative permease IIC component YwbA [Schleiferilactobacillus harbinensis]